MQGRTRGVSARQARSAAGGKCALAASAVLLACGSASGGSPSEPIPVTSQRFEISYRLNRDAEPLQAIELWYTRDRGHTWHLYGLDDDRRSPITFNAPGEGLYGLTVVLYNAAGASSPRPGSGTTPQSWTLVDYTPPVLQLHQARLIAAPSSQPRIQLSWSAYDAHLPARPIELSYRQPGQPSWTPIDARLANVGRADWCVPDGVSGPVEIRVLVRDRVGHVAVREFSPVTVEPAPLPSPEATAGRANEAAATQPAGDKAALYWPGPQEASEAERLYELGTWFLLRGRLDVAELRFLEALELDPTHKAARNDLAGVLLRRGAAAEAIQNYQSVLDQDDDFLPAARGLALALAAQKRYSEAAVSLRRILKARPSDPQTLLELGDVLLLGGDPGGARRRWMEVTRQSGVPTEILRDATTRLQTYTTSPPK